MGSWICGRPKSIYTRASWLILSWRLLASSPSSHTILQWLDLAHRIRQSCKSALLITKFIPSSLLTGLNAISMTSPSQATWRTYTSRSTKITSARPHQPYLCSSTLQCKTMIYLKRWYRTNPNAHLDFVILTHGFKLNNIQCFDCDSSFSYFSFTSIQVDLIDMDIKDVNSEASES